MLHRLQLCGAVAAVDLQVLASDADGASLLLHRGCKAVLWVFVWRLLRLRMLNTWAATSPDRQGTSNTTDGTHSPPQHLSRKAHACSPLPSGRACEL